MSKPTDTVEKASRPSFSERDTRYQALLRRALARLPLLIAIGLLLNLAVFRFGAERVGLATILHSSGLPILIGTLLTFVPWWTRTLRIRIWANALRHPLSGKSALRVVLGSEVLAAASPTAAGGAPAQAALLYRAGLSPGAALALTAVSPIEDGLFFLLSVPLAIWLSPSIDLASLGTLLAESVRPPSLAPGSAFQIVVDNVGLLVVIGIVLVAALVVIRLLRRPRDSTVASLQERFRKWLATTKLQFADAIQLLWKERQRLWRTLPLAALQWTSRYAVVSCVAWGLGLSPDPFLLFVLQCLLFSILVLVPSPGAMGGAEIGFLAFHRGFAGTEVGALLVAWRTLTFFLPAAVGAILLILLERAEPNETGH